MEVYLIIAVIAFIFALMVKPLRKTMGLLFIIFGVIGLFSLIGFLPGVIAIFIGGFLMFI